MVEPNTPSTQSEPVDLSSLIPEADWAVPARVIDLARGRDLDFALGGGLAFSAYSGHWRNTKDTDLYIRPDEREAMIEALSEAGLTDYYDIEEYDRRWIYRGYRDGVILDIIWAMANQRAQVDESWLTGGREVEIHGLRLKMLPPEELIWAKLYIMQRDRCDWPDLLNVIEVEGPRLNWDHLLQRVGQDSALLGGLMSVFSWLCPARAYELPAWIWSWMGILLPAAGPSCEEDRRQVLLLDSREWFGRTTEGY